MGQNACTVDSSDPSSYDKNACINYVSEAVEVKQANTISGGSAAYGNIMANTTFELDMAMVEIALGLTKDTQYKKKCTTDSECYIERWDSSNAECDTKDGYCVAKFSDADCSACFAVPGNEPKKTCDALKMFTCLSGAVLPRPSPRPSPSPSKT